ncbi:efflux RND transporter periplasmic adaptor subunit [uncultured Sphingomonas sp.]|uniref:efflux RND transporter periplasmic adaptor subunit n=1 Tax=uncultured Sphingomonas sp. TaxID=158754 RepID=UPI0025D39642|nr:efflux RND transporter periplasmic adaptor subunit [uncultured Sphingomonas sp.]
MTCIPRHRRFRTALAPIGLALMLGACSSTPNMGPARDDTRHPGEFRPTDQQWGNLHFVKAVGGQYAPALLTDGQIATDDDRTTQLFSPFTGRISRIFVKPGDVVRRGQPIYAIVASELVQGRSDIATAEAAVAAARKALTTAEANAARQQALLAVQGAAQRDVQQAQSDLASARSTLASSEAQLSAARGRLQVLGMGGTAGHGRDEAIVRSPIDGTVTVRNAGIGQYVESAASGASTPLFTISDLSHVWLVANVREADAGKLRQGATLSVTVPAFPGRNFDARVYYIAPVVDPNTRRIVVRAQIANPDGALRPNMFATARLSDGVPVQAVEIPAMAVLYEGDDAHVWVAHPERHSLSLRAIRTGTSTGDAVTVTQGLTPGEEVVTAGSVFIDRANGGD